MKLIENAATNCCVNSLSRMRHPRWQRHHPRRQSVPVRDACKICRDNNNAFDADDVEFGGTLRHMPLGPPAFSLARRAFFKLRSRCFAAAFMMSAKSATS